MKKFLIGLCGLPNSGKSTLIKLLSKVETEIAPYPFTTLKPKEVAVPIVTSKLDELWQITKTEEKIPGYLFFLDVPGLIKGAHRGEGLGNEFLSYLRQADYVLEVVRNFERSDVSHIEGSLNPERDILIIENEIIEADKRIIEDNLTKLQKTKDKKIEAIISHLEKLLRQLEPFRRFPEYQEPLREYNLLLAKDWLLLFNGSKLPSAFQTAVSNQPDKYSIFSKVYQLDFLWELQLAEENELKTEIESGVESFLQRLVKDLGLIQFFTLSEGKITQLWFIKQGSTIVEAAGLIHSDFQEKFKYAEIVSLEKFKEAGSWKQAKEQGIVMVVGREYVVQNGDIVKIFIH
jgi:hypothetical protein